MSKSDRRLAFALFSPYKLAGFIIAHFMLKAMNYFGVLGTAYIKAVTLSQGQHFLHLHYVHFKKKPDVDKLDPCRHPCSVKYLIAVIAVDIQHTDKCAPFYVFFKHTVKNKAAQLRRRIILYDLHIQMLRSLYHSFNINGSYCDQPLNNIL